jgi:hypothetical protein
MGSKSQWRRFGGMVDGYGIVADDSTIIIPREAFNGLGEYGAQIVREHNAHDALVAALKVARQALYSSPIAPSAGDGLFIERRRQAKEQINAALKLAEGETTAPVGAEIASRL